MEKFDREKYSPPAKKFKALGHPLRLWLVRQVMDEPHCVQELVALTDFDFSTISQHLNALKEADILTGEKRGKQVFYTLKCSCVRTFLKCVEEQRKSGKSRKA